MCFQDNFYDTLPVLHNTDFCLLNYREGIYNKARYQLPLYTHVTQAANVGKIWDPLKNPETLMELRPGKMRYNFNGHAIQVTITTGYL